MSDESRDAASNLLEEWYAHRTGGPGSLGRAAYLREDILAAMTQAKYLEMASMLRQLEWQDGDHGLACPICKSIAYGFPKRGDRVHNPGCHLHALLLELP